MVGKFLEKKVVTEVGPLAPSRVSIQNRAPSRSLASRVTLLKVVASGPFLLACEGKKRSTSTPENAQCLYIHMPDRPWSTFTLPNKCRMSIYIEKL